MILRPELVQFIKQHPEVRAISSHHVRFPTPTDEHIHFAYCCFLRHPLDRLMSLYAFLRATRDSSDVGQLAQQGSPALFFAEMIERLPNYISNVQTGYFHPAAFSFVPLAGKIWKRLFALCRNAHCRGVVHRMDESLAAAEYF